MIVTHTPVWTDGLHPWSDDQLDGMARGICYTGGDNPGPTQTESKVTQTSLPDYAQPYYDRLMQRAESESNQPYTTYGGQRVSDFSGASNNAFNLIGHTANSPIQGMGQALDYAQNGLNTQAPQWGQAAASQYMSPYVSNVIGQLAHQMDTRFDEQHGARDAQAVQAGAFGGSRAAIAEMQAQRDHNDQVNSMIAQQLQNAYTNAEGQFNADRSAQFDADRLGQGYAQLLSQLNGDYRNLAYGDASQLLKAGQLQEGKQQQNLDVAYNDFVNQRDWNKGQINYLSGVMHGVPVSPNSDVASFQSQPSVTNQLLGAGIGALGAASKN